MPDGVGVAGGKGTKVGVAVGSLSSIGKNCCQPPGVPAAGCLPEDEVPESGDNDCPEPLDLRPGGSVPAEANVGRPMNCEPTEAARPASMTNAPSTSQRRRHGSGGVGSECVGIRERSPG